ncbi:MAG: response regulator [Verrucomicrobia bacterium]|nr:response regulator [Verrucomicrobiota bacterium]MCH8528117.1 response regulator [Kiritimatiellia bacterium]
MEPAALIEKLTKEQKSLRKELFLNASEQPTAWKEIEPGPCDPAGGEALRQVFSRTPAGKLEALRLETDVLRRARGRRPELFQRPFGTARWITPVLRDHRVVHVLDSGPVKVNPWTPAEKETLAKTCGVSVKNLPAALDNMVVFTPEQLPILHQQQIRLALAMGRLLQQPEPAASGTDTPTGVSLDVLQPGFADHLAHLFQALQAELPSLPGSGAADRMLLAVQRGRHLVEQLQRLNRQQTQRQENVAVHSLLQKWTAHLQQETGARFELKLQAVQDRLIANPHAVNHLLYTLLAGVADGLRAQGGLIGVGTRNDTLDNQTVLHLEIRDSDGLATFAGVSLAWDEDVISEQNEASREYADWVGLAQRMDARLRILRENDVITRIELLLPLNATAAFEETGADPDAAQIWMVLENEPEAKQLQHMFKEYGARVHWLRSGKELREHYLTASAPPDLILLEYLLSDTRGIALRSWLYEQDTDLPVILMSGFSATHPGIATASNLPSTLYLQKPFDTQTLFDMLHMTLDRKA